MEEKEKKDSKYVVGVFGKEQLRQVVEKLVNELPEGTLEQPEEFGVSVYPPDKWEEIQQYEMNMVLDDLGIQHWNRPTSSWDGLGLPVDEPLGEYTADKLKEYTDEEHTFLSKAFILGWTL